jgi:hypothetical protein
MGSLTWDAIHRKCGEADLRAKPHASGAKEPSPGKSSQSGLEQTAKTDGERGWIRTSDPRLKRALLYQLSYAPTLLLI